MAPHRRSLADRIPGPAARAACAAAAAQGVCTCMRCSSVEQAALVGVCCLLPLPGCHLRESLKLSQTVLGCAAKCCSAPVDTSGCWGSTGHTARTACHTPLLNVGVLGNGDGAYCCCQSAASVVCEPSSDSRSSTVASRRLQHPQRRACSSTCGPAAASLRALLLQHSTVQAGWWAQPVSVSHHYTCSPGWLPLSDLIACAVLQFRQSCVRVLVVCCV